MTLRFAWPLWALIIFTIVVLGLLALGFKRSNRGERRQWVRRSILAAMVLIIGMTPAIPIGLERVSTNLEVYFVLDRSLSMLAEDQNGGTRLAAATADIKQLSGQFSDARYAAYTFSSGLQREVPLTTDGRAVRSWADTVLPEIVDAAQGSGFQPLTVDLVNNLLEEKHENPGHIRILILLTDGEVTAEDDANKTDWDQLKPLVDGGLILGYGTPEGGRMRTYTGGDLDPEGPFIIDSKNGQPAISHANPKELEKIAKKLGAEFIQPGSDTDFTASVLQLSKNAEAIAAEDNRAEQVVYRDYVWPFVWVALAMLAWELLYLGSRIRSLREETR